MDFFCDANGRPIEWVDVVSLSEVGRQYHFCLESKLSWDFGANLRVLGAICLASVVDVTCAILCLRTERAVMH